MKRLALVMVLAACGGPPDETQGAPDAAPAIPDAAAVLSPPPVWEIEGYGGSSSVRQGAEVTLRVSGSGLDGAHGVRVGSWEAAIVDRDATSVRARLSVPHGAEKRGYQVSLEPGGLLLPGALEVTHIVAAPRGSDATGRGTDDLPFRTLTLAAAAALGGDLIELEDGTFEEGEVWPVGLPGGVNLTGAGSSRTLLRPLIGDEAVLLLRGGNRVAQLSIDGQGADRCVATTAASTEPQVASRLAGMVISGCRIGVSYLQDADLVLMDATVRGNDDVGVFFRSDNVVALERSEIADGKTGLHLAGKGGAVTIDSRVHHTTVAGIAVVDGAGVVQFTRSSVSASAGYAVAVSSSGSAILLGKDHEAGAFSRLQAPGVVVADLRPPRDRADGPIVDLQGAELNGRTVAGATISVGPDADLPYWSIAGTNNRLRW